MGTTTRLSLRYPELADSADVPRDIENLASDIDSAAIFSKGTFASRPTSTVGSPGIDGRYYFATDTSRLYLDTGTSWVEVASGADSVTSSMIAADAVDSSEIKASAVGTSELASGAVTSAKIASGATSTTYVTSLPSSPVDGQEVYLATNGVYWHLRWNASASSANYKWEFLGGSPIVSLVGTSTATSPFTAFAYFRTSSYPEIIVPCPGEYLCFAQASGYSTSGTTAEIQMHVRRYSSGGSPYGATPSLVGGQYLSGTLRRSVWSGFAFETLLDIGASQRFSVVYSTGASNLGVEMEKQMLTIQPIRVG